MAWVAQIVAVISIIAGQVQGVAQYVAALPPAPDQSQLACRDLAWEAQNLVPVTGSRIHKELAPLATNLITEARTEGIGMSIAVAYRNCDFQLQLRSMNCGTGDYNLYQKPSNLCTPPTEPAGKSMHNEGLAIDFTCDGYSLFEYSPCLTWLKQHADKYHLFNHSIEAWHWSTTGI